MIRRIGLDKLVIKSFFTSDVREKMTLDLVLEFLGLDIGEARYEKLKKREVYFFKDHGIDVKVLNHFLMIEFHSTFFCFENAFEMIRQSCLFISEKVGMQISITEMHIAQDHDDIKPSDFFAKGFDHYSYHKAFKAIYQPFVGTEKLETFYLKDGGKNRWSFICYNKSLELKKNKSNSSIFKNQYYEKLGYFDDEITRIELKLNSEITRRHFDAFFSLKSEQEFCHHVLGSFYKKHKVYHLEINETFNEKHPESHKKYYLWHQIFNHRIQKQKSKDFEEIYELETLSEKEVIQRLSNLLSKSKFHLTEELISKIFEEAKIKKKEKFKRREQTYQHQKEVLDLYSRNYKELLALDKETGKAVSNPKNNSFFQTKIREIENASGITQSDSF
ncbi:MAG: hypothetical protein CMK74_05535 [Pseudomonadales bacterium]|nr:hypothetical protein [Pseudomonadales bacterium]|tara:strand:+ start:1677 stop:2843 length:1167 start_codon:yes stop_codon:yes gene_type:complete